MEARVSTVELTGNLTFVLYPPGRRPRSRHDPQRGRGAGQSETGVIVFWRYAVKPDLPQKRLALRDMQGIVPALPGRSSDDFEDQIEEAMEDEARRIVAGLRAEWEAQDGNSESDAS
jgi:hypothetical protein